MYSSVKDNLVKSSSHSPKWFLMKVNFNEIRRNLTKKLSCFSVVLNLIFFCRLEQFGGICDCQSTRDTFLYAASVDSRGLDATVEIIADVVLRPEMSEEEIDIARYAVRSGSSCVFIHTCQQFFFFFCSMACHEPVLNGFNQLLSFGTVHSF